MCGSVFRNSGSNNKRFAAPDTAKLWSSSIDGGTFAIDFSGDDYYTVFGIHVFGASTHTIRMRSGSDNNAIFQCKFTGAALAEVAYRAANDSVISCLFLSSANTAFDTGTGFGTGNVVLNNTMYGSNSVTAWNVQNSGGGMKYRNNIAYNTSSTTPDHAGRTTDRGVIDDFNNNIWYAPDVTNTWEFNGASFDLLATWVDSVNNNDVDGATNSLNTDPALQAVTRTAHILDTSAAFEAGTDLGYGTDIGYYQVVAAAAAETPATKKGVRPRWWN